VPVGRQGTVGPGIELSREAKIAHAYDAARGSRG
jgi:hypothetical protein